MVCLLEQGQMSGMGKVVDLGLMQSTVVLFRASSREWRGPSKTSII
jgi:hypothetical protein